MNVFLAKIFLLASVLMSCTYNQYGHKEERVGQIYGIDLSHHQGKIDWSKVREVNGHEISFVFIKATEGATYQDPLYKSNFTQAKSNGLKVGSYHYFRTTSSVADQLANFKRSVNKADQLLIPMIDIEENDNLSTEEFNAHLLKFLKGIEQYYHCKPILYSTQRFYNTHLKEKYLDYHWMIGRFSKQKPVLQDSNKWTIWQYSDKGQVDGIDKAVDLDVLRFGIKIDVLTLKK